MSEQMTCHGLKWKIVVWPGGHENSKKDEQMVSVGLFCIPSYEEGLKVPASLVCKIMSPTNPSPPPNAHAKATSAKPNGPPVAVVKETSGVFSKGASRSGIANFVRRHDVMNKHLVKGALVVEIEISVALEKKCWDALKEDPTGTGVDQGLVVGLKKEIKAKKPLSADMLKLLETADVATSDVLFEVGGGKAEEKQTFHAHRLILSARCPTLNALVETRGAGSQVSIEDTEPAMFRKLLRFIYGGEIPDQAILKKEARAIIRVADRFGCTGLKHAAEAELASSGIKNENNAEMITFADTTKCALLKEAALDYFVANSEAVMATDGYEKVKDSPSIMGDMMAALSAAASIKKRPPATPGGDGKDYKRMRVTNLREELDAKGLDTDGSKEMLANRLQTAETENEAAEALSQIHRSTVTP